jgi:hypothetical protein
MLLSEFVQDRKEYNERINLSDVSFDDNMEKDHLEAIISTFQYIQNNIPNIQEPECFYESDGLYGLIWRKNNRSFTVYVTWYGKVNYECLDPDVSVFQKNCLAQN